MPAAIQGKCPGCKKILRIPADWVNQAVHCKHCGMAVQIRPKSKSDKIQESTPLPSAPPDVPQTPLPDSPARSKQAPNPSAPATAQSAMAFSTEDDRPIVRVADRFRSRRHRSIALGVGIGLLALLSTGFYFAWPHLGKVKTELLANAREDDSESAVEETTSPVHETSSTTSKHDASAVPSTPRLPTGGVFPRRLLTICVHNYLFANPVSYGEASGQNFHALTDKLARVLHVPATQVVELSDAAPGQRPAPAPARSKGKSGAPRSRRHGSPRPAQPRKQSLNKPSQSS